MYKLFAVISLFAAFGCSTLPEQKLNQVSLGMNKTEVLTVMGPPTSTKAKDNVETLVYFQGGTFWTWGHTVRPNKEYWVILQSGKVTQYGAAGDFGTSEMPAQHVIVEKTGAK